MALRARLLELDPDLGAGLDEAGLQLARERLIVRTERVPEGQWDPDAPPFDVGHGIGLLVVDGLAVLRTVLGHRAAGELIGPGALLRPWQERGEHTAYSLTWSLSVLEALTVAVLDPPFAARLGPFPQVTGELVGRAAERAFRLGGYLAISQLAVVEDRVLVALWHMADDWGRVRPDGVLLPLRLTHATLASLVGTRRPSVTSALSRLGGRNLVTPQHGGGWLLHGDPPNHLHVRGRADQGPADAIHQAPL